MQINPAEYLRSMYEVFEEREKVRKLRIYLIAGSLLIGWGILVILVLRTPQIEPHVHVSAPAVVPSSSPVNTNSNGLAIPTMRPSSLTRRRVAIQAPTSPVHSTQQGGSGFSMTIHTTSSASPVSIGGGGGGGGSYSGSSHSQKTSSPVATTSYPVIAFVPTMPSTSSMVESSPQRLVKRSLSAENTLSNIQGVIEQNGPNASVPLRAKKDGWDDYEQDDEPFLDPIGDVTWGWMLLLTIGWCVRVHRKRQQACK